ncbi:hypothetical protein J2741_000855 [Methanolinea mesophila]|nr:hypothetical protein [Methanolinea mesophila]
MSRPVEVSLFFSDFSRFPTGFSGNEIALPRESAPHEHPEHSDRNRIRYEISAISHTSDRKVPSKRCEKNQPANRPIIGAGHPKKPGSTVPHTVYPATPNIRLLFHSGTPRETIKK